MQRADMQVCPYNTVLCRGEPLLSPAEHFKTVQGQRGLTATFVKGRHAGMPLSSTTYLKGCRGEHKCSPCLT